MNESQRKKEKNMAVFRDCSLLNYDWALLLCCSYILAIIQLGFSFNFCSFIYLFFSIWVFFHEHLRFTGQEGKGKAISLSPLLALPPTSQTLRQWAGDYCRELTSANNWQPDPNRERLVSERKSLTTKLRVQRVVSSIGYKFNCLPSSYLPRLYLYFHKTYG